MTDSVKISVIIPVFNASKFLQRALNSLYIQSLQTIEIIIIDDASKDNSLDIILSNQVNDSRIHCLKNKTNQGLSYCRNIAIKVATGEYIFFLDADDEIINNNALKILYDEASKSSVELIVFDFYKIYNGLKKYKTRNLQNGIILDKIASKKQFTKAGVCCWNKLYCTKFLKTNQIIFPEGLCFEDIPFTWQVSTTANRILYLKQAFYAYYQTSGSIMNSYFDNKKNSDIIKIMEIVYDYLISHNLYIEYKNIYELRLFTTFTYFFKKSNSKSYKLFINMANALQKIDLLAYKSSLSRYKYIKYKTFLAKKYFIYRLFFVWI